MACLFLPSSNLLLCGPVDKVKIFMAIIGLTVSKMLGEPTDPLTTLSSRLQRALKQELQRGINVVDHDHDVRQRFSHLSSQR